MTYSVGVIGFGRFGRVLYNILRKGFLVKIHDPSMDHKTTGALNQEFDQAEFVDWNTLLKEKVIFIAVPINRFKEVVEKMAPSLTEVHTIIDVCSVKMYPTQIMSSCLPPETGIIATHPLFGPDSYMGHGIRHKMMMHLERPCLEDRDHRQYHTWKDFFLKQGIEIVEMTPEEHDRLAAETQGLTHYLGRCLKEYGIRRTTIDTQGFTSLLELVDQTCNDTWELYLDLQKFNPFTQEMVAKFDHSVRELNNRSQLKLS